jgi:uncharacterized protein with FMN-binding domain
VRKQSRITLGVIGLSTLTTSYLLGHQAAESNMSLAASATTTTPTQEADSTTAQVTSPATTEAAPEATATADATTEPTATTEPAPSATATSEPAPSATTAPAATSGTYTSQTVQYRYGRIQLEIAVTDGALTDINLLQATTEGRGYDQAPPILVNAALQAGGTNFGNLSGATFTTQAFKQALDDALAQAGLN